MFGLGHGHRVIGGNADPGGQQVFDDFAAGGLEHVVGVGFEGQALQGKVFACQVCPEADFDFAAQHVLLGVVGGIYGVEHFQVQAGIGNGGFDGRDSK